jgi:hypothetical protein
MDIREKLVELFDEAARICNNQDCRACGYFREANCINKTIIDHLIANGVTVQEEVEELKADNQRLCEMWAKAVSELSKAAVQEWIPVTARFPAKDTEVLCFKGRYIGTLMDVYTYVGNCKWEDTYGNRSCTEDEGITHWMPLPEAPKGE